MLWLITKNTSYEITSCNTHNDNGTHQLWVTKSNGKSVKINESNNKQEINTIKDAIDYAIETKETALRLS